MRRCSVWVVIMVTILGAAIAGADEPTLDPLLQLLVKRGLITMEEAQVVQAEYDRQDGQEAQQAAAVPPPTEAQGPASQEKAESAVPKGLKGLSIGSLVYLSYQNGNTVTGEDLSQFRIKRGYIDIKKEITPYFDARITPDVYQDEKGDLKMRLKYAYGQFSWKWDGLIQKPVVEWGVVHMPWLDFEEHINRFRMQDTMFMERNGLFNSADLGVYFGGNFGPEMPEDFRNNVQGHFAGRWGSFGVGVYNGGGYHAAENNTNKALEGRLTFRPLPDIAPGLQLSMFGITGKGNRSDVLGEQYPDMQVLAAMVSYESRPLVLTAQYERGKGNQGGSAVDPNGTALPHDGYSVFTEVRLDRDQKFSLIGRYDRFDTHREDPTYDVKTRYIAGVAWQFYKGNYWVLDFDRLEHTIPGYETEDRVQLTLQLKY